MINNNELLFVVDELNQPQEPLPRHLVHKKILWHRTTSICVVNQKRQILCQKRSMKKDMNPGMWEMHFGGHVEADEGYLHNALGELSQELGIEVDKEKLFLFNIFPLDNIVHKKHEATYLYLINRDDTNFPVEQEEVDEVKWIDLTEITKIADNKKDNWGFNPWDKELIAWISQLY